MTATTTGTATTGTYELARAVVGLRFADLPAAVVTLARQCLLDVLGTMLAGTREPAGRIVAEVMAGERSASALALRYGTAAHALDFDDVISTVGHPSVAVAPAVLALAREHGGSGPDLLTAFVAGVETQARMGAAVGPEHYARGFHSTATFGSYGSAAACSRLLRLDPAATVAALGIAGTQAAGLKAVFGTMSKPLHAGRAAANGVLAAQLARRGFSSAQDIVGDPQGFAATQSDRYDPGALAGPFGDPWRLLDVRFKMHAACFLTHASIDSLTGLAGEHGFGAADVAGVEVAVPPGHLAVCGIPAPRTGLEGKFSLRLTAALALLGGGAGPEVFTDAAVRDPAVVAVRDRVAVTPDGALSGPVARVRVRLADGRDLAAHRDMREPAWRADPAEQQPALLAKFHALADPVVGADRAAGLARLVADLDTLADVRPLCESLYGR
jgi:2-methylcitrate dehydratase PrpD